MTFEEYLAKFDETAWLAALEELLPSIHEVDRDAVQIWFRFYPLSLHRFAGAAADREELIRGLALKGDFELSAQIDSSHHFLYGHRYWKKIKYVTEKTADEYAGEDTPLVETIRSVAMAVAKKLKVDRSLTNAIAAVGLMTLNQIGLDAFKAGLGEVVDPAGVMKKSADAIVAERSKDASQGIFGFLRTVDKKFAVSFTSSCSVGKFPVMIDEEIATASQKDHSGDWQAHDERCWEGPVPIECTSASCGTCWVGVLGGADKLADVKPRERRAMKVFGYNQPDEAKPFIRLACQARVAGNVTIVIPPWNGVFGKKVYGNVDELVLEPNTTSAKHLREVIKAAATSE